MNRYRTPAFIFSAVFGLIVSSCGAGNSHPEDIVPLDSKLGKISLKKNSIKFDETARFIAGRPFNNERKFHKITSAAWYQNYKKNIEKSWKGFFSPNMNNIRTWRKKNLTGKYSTSVFYPFSGPDVLNPLLFYPDARDILMFGLEPTGGIPDMSGMSPSQLRQQTGRLLSAINFTLDHAFFVTTDMQKKVKRSSLNGISAIMFFFLSRDGYTVHHAGNIYITAEGKLQEGPGSRDKREVKGIEILFSKGAGTPLKRVRYFKIDISDKSRQFTRFSKYAHHYGAVTTIVKSASYLMSWNTFSKIRSLLLDRSESILQDDSGIPYKYLKNTGKWQLSYFGKYHRPLPVFKSRYQRDLQADLKKHSKGLLPFAYGYGYGYPDMTYHLIRARKK